MKITTEIKLGELLKEHPFLIEFLPTLSPKFNRLKNPVLRRTLAANATLERVAKMGGIDAEALIKIIHGEIRRREGDSIEDRKEVLKSIIRDLHAGARAKFKGLMFILKQHIDTITKEPYS